MFGRKKDAAKISDKTPVFHVRYIGCTETYVATGKGCSYAPVQRLWDNSPAERNMRKVAVHIKPTGISLRDHNEKQTTSHQQQQQLNHNHHHQQQNHSQDFDIENISFCNVDRAVNERIFSWIYRQERQNRLDCYAVLCSTAQKAQTMAIVLSRAFQIAYKDWRAHHRDYDPSANRSPASPAPKMNSLSSSENKSGNNGSVVSPSSASSSSSFSAATLTSQSTAAITSPQTSSTERKTDTEPSTSSENIPPENASPPMFYYNTPPPHKSARFSDDVTVVVAPPPPPLSDDGDTRAQKGVGSSVSVQQSATSTFFVSSSIWDPDMEDIIGGVDSLQADLDLEEEEEGSF